MMVEKSETQKGEHLVNIAGLLLMMTVWLAPFMFAPFTSELFELNKMHFVYLLVGLLSVMAGLLVIQRRQLVIPKTVMDIPIMLFLTALVITTITSIHPYTSIFGYYTRFHGGLASYVAYALLFCLTICFIAIHPLRQARTRLLLNGWLVAIVVVAIYGILQHFGIDDHIWKQDVVNRVFSSLGQPNWLAAVLCVAMGISWIQLWTSRRLVSWRTGLAILVFGILYLCLMYTRSRSGFLGMTGAAGVFGGLTLLYAWRRKELLYWLKRAGLLAGLALIVSLSSSTPFTPSLTDWIQRSDSAVTVSTNNPLVPIGGTDSGQIRKIVWRGAYELGKQHWLVGTGLETFGYSYYWVRPVEHNLVSEWDFIYNRAHNEYLNWWATTGVVGTGTYVILLLAGYWVFLKPYVAWWRGIEAENEPEGQSLIWMAGLAAGFTSILITNFFGFSVVVIGMWLFLLPASGVLLSVKSPYRTVLAPRWLAWLLGGGIVGVSLIWIAYVGNAYYANLYYATAQTQYRQQHYDTAFVLMETAQRHNPWEPTLMDYASKNATNLALYYFYNDEPEVADLTRQYAIQKSDQALDNNPYHSTYWKNQADRMITLSTMDSEYLTHALASLLLAEELAPTDPKILYNQALLYARLQDLDTAIDTLERALELKPNYIDAMFGAAVYYHRRGLDADNAVVNPADHAKGIEYMELFLQYAPNDTNKQEMLQEWQAEVNY